MIQTKYDVKCPKCSSRAIAVMKVCGRKGTYREPFLQLGAHRILCESCGHCRVVPENEAQTYELWYVTYCKGHRLWAVNRKHLSFLISWFSGEVKWSTLEIADRADVEAYQKWMTLAKNKKEILKQLQRLLKKSATTGKAGGLKKA